MPRYIHDCDKCQYLGECEEYDLYACQGLWWPTYIARYGNESHEYGSASELVLDTMVVEFGKDDQTIAKYVECRKRYDQLKQGENHVH